MKKIRIKQKYMKRIKRISYISIMIISFVFAYYLLVRVKLYSSNEEFIMNMLKDSNYYMKYENKSLITKLANYFYKIDLKEPTTLLTDVFNYDNQFDEEYNPEQL